MSVSCLYQYSTPFLHLLHSSTYTLSTQERSFHFEYNPLLMLSQRGISRFKVINGKLLVIAIFYMAVIFDFHFRSCLQKNDNINPAFYSKYFFSKYIFRQIHRFLEKDWKRVGNTPFFGGGGPLSCENKSKILNLYMTYFSLVNVDPLCYWNQLKTISSKYFPDYSNFGLLTRATTWMFT